LFAARCRREQAKKLAADPVTFLDVAQQRKKQDQQDGSAENT
jgi:hypothetical protein